MEIPHLPSPILLVTDDSTESLTIGASLRAEDPALELRLISSESDFLLYLETGALALVITDARTNWTDGLSVLRAVKIRYPHCPVIVRADIDDEEILEEAIRAGAEDCLLKSPRHVLRLPALVRAVQERIKQQQTWREAERHSHDLFQYSEGLICTHDLDGVLLSVNPAGARLLGYSVDELIGRNLAEFVAPVVRHRFGHYLALIRQEPHIRGFLHVITNTGEERILAYHNVRREGGDRPPYILGHAQDVTELKRAEAQLHTYAQQQQRQADELEQRVAERTTELQESRRLTSQAADRLALLHTIDQAILAEQPLVTILQEALPRVRSLVSCLRVGVVQFDFDTQEAMLLAVESSTTTLLPTGIRGPLMALRPHSMNLAAFQQGHPYEVVDLDTLTDLPFALLTVRAEGIRSLLSLPLIAGGELFGSLNLGKAEPQAFTAMDKAIGQEIANQLAIAFQQDRNRTAHQQAEAQLQEEAEVKAALAHVGEELMASLDTPTILERLCQLTIDVLRCEQGSTVIWRPEKQAYVVAATAGHTQEVDRMLRSLTFPEEMVPHLITRLKEEDVVEVAIDEPQNFLPHSLFSLTGARSSLYIALRRGTDLLGCQTATYRTHQRFHTTQKRIAQGLAHLASLTLANARLVEDLEYANRLKDDFVNTMSHELRTPLHIIMGYTDILIDGLYGEPSGDQLNALQRISLSTRELIDLVNNVLDLDRLRKRQLSLTPQTLGVESWLADLQTSLLDLHRHPTVHLQWETAPALPVLVTDPEKLKIVLKNLISNALKFTEAGTVTVITQPEGTGIEFCVKDTGIGIAQEHLALIFEPFRQVDSSTTQIHAGVGLGLHIVRQLVDLLGGRVAVESTLGMGSTFRVWIPQHHPARP